MRVEGRSGGGGASGASDHNDRRRHHHHHHHHHDNQRAEAQPLLVGSVKTNIGHTESAAGIAGLIKIVLSLERQQIPAHLHFKQLNPHISLDDLPVIIPTELVPWRRMRRSEVRGSVGNLVDKKRRIAGLSSFGFSGTNAHAIIEEAENDGDDDADENVTAHHGDDRNNSKSVSGHDSDGGGGGGDDDDGNSGLHQVSYQQHKYSLLVLSAKSEKSLRDLSEIVERHLFYWHPANTTDSCGVEWRSRSTIHCNLCHEFSVRRTHFIDNHRMAIVAASVKRVHSLLHRVNGGLLSMPPKEKNNSVDHYSDNNNMASLNSVSGMVLVDNSWKEDDDDDEERPMTNSSDGRRWKNESLYKVAIANKKTSREGVTVKFVFSDDNYKNGNVNNVDTATNSGNVLLPYVVWRQLFENEGPFRSLAMHHSLFTKMADSSSSSSIIMNVISTRGGDISVIGGDPSKFSSLTVDKFNVTSTPTTPHQCGQLLLLLLLLVSPATLAIQYSLSHLWVAIGINPSTVSGCGIVGNLAAACLSKVFTLSYAFQLISEVHSLFTRTMLNDDKEMTGNSKNSNSESNYNSKSKNDRNDSRWINSSSSNSNGDSSSSSSSSSSSNCNSNGDNSSRSSSNNNNRDNNGNTAMDRLYQQLDSFEIKLETMHWSHLNTAPLHSFEGQLATEQNDQNNTSATSRYKSGKYWIELIVFHCISSMAHHIDSLSITPLSPLPPPPTLSPPPSPPSNRGVCVDFGGGSRWCALLKRSDNIANAVNNNNNNHHSTINSGCFLHCWRQLQTYRLDDKHHSISSKSEGDGEEADLDAYHYEREADDWSWCHLLKCFSELYIRGIDLNWPTLFQCYYTSPSSFSSSSSSPSSSQLKSKVEQFIYLPNYPFDHSISYWISSHSHPPIDVHQGKTLLSSPSFRLIALCSLQGVGIC